MTDLQLCVWERACDNASWGPWRSDAKEVRRPVGRGQSFIVADCSREHDGIRSGDADAHFIAVARTALPALIAEVRALRAHFAAQAATADAPTDEDVRWLREREKKALAMTEECDAAWPSFYTAAAARYARIASALETHLHNVAAIAAAAPDAPGVLL